jgi:hypothetical protein
VINERRLHFVQEKHEKLFIVQKKTTINVNQEKKDRNTSETLALVYL